uniref:Phorbol-ester/DAG-type domain-containing protein n=1 Tax=Romanomermis culicivorax TaxID=13658 RepID=A0A915L4A1_ROMCU
MNLKSFNKSPMIRTDAQLDLYMNVRQQKDRSNRYWTEITTPGEHIWVPTSGNNDCYIGETDCSKAGDKLKCAACHIIAHEGCLAHLSRMSFNCKRTYSEACVKQSKDQQYQQNNAVVRHHWVHKWRQEGRCKHCGKTFQSKFLNRIQEINRAPTDDYN